MSKSASNPLAGLMRRPKLKVSLPSRGDFYAKNSIELADNNEYDVYAITARDELTLKNTALLANGQSIVKIFESCVPAIKNGLEVPSIDVDTLVTAIKIASKGAVEKVAVEVNDKTYQVEVNLLDIISKDLPEWDPVLVIDEITYYLKPAAYKIFINISQQALLTQKIFNVVNDEKIDEEKKLEVFKDNFTKLTNITMSIVQNSVFKIEVGDEVVVDKKFIDEYIENCESSVFTSLKNRLDELNTIYSLSSIEIEPTDEMKKDGITDLVTVDLSQKIASFLGGEN